MNMAGGAVARLPGRSPADTRTVLCVRKAATCLCPRSTAREIMKDSNPQGLRFGEEDARSLWYRALGFGRMDHHHTGEHSCTFYGMESVSALHGRDAVKQRGPSLNCALFNTLWEALSRIYKPSQSKRNLQSSHI